MHLYDLIQEVKALKMDEINRIITEAKEELSVRSAEKQFKVYVVDGTHRGSEFASFDYTEAAEALLAHIWASKYDIGDHRFRVNERSMSKADADALIEDINRGRDLEEYIKEQGYSRDSGKRFWELYYKSANRRQ